MLGAKGNKSQSTYAANGAKAVLESWLTIRGDEAGPLFLPIRKGSQNVKVTFNKNWPYPKAMSGVLLSRHSRG